MEWAFVATLTGQLCEMFQVLAKELKETMFPTDLTQQPVGAQGNLLTQQRMRKAETACKVKYGEDASLAVVFDLFLDVDWNPAMGYGPNKFDKDKPEKTDRIGGAATTTDPMLNIIVQLLLILRGLPPLPHYPDYFSPMRTMLLFRIPCGSTSTWSKQAGTGARRITVS